MRVMMMRGVVLAWMMTTTMMMNVGEGSWCVCKSGTAEVLLQKTLDYACGAGADCNSVHQNGNCFNPNTVLAHCNYAVNSYYQRKLSSGATCDFSGTAMLTNSDPSSGTCSYPASASSATNTGTVPVTPTTTSTTNPYTTTNPNNGILGGMGPAGTNLDDSAVAFRIIPPTTPFASGLLLIIIVIMLL